MNALDILVKYWGYTKFRLRQEEIINQIILKQDTLALLPTGGGKSLCYQIYSIMNPGICIVISPLISLMNDQVSFLNSKGIKSLFISSSISSNDLDRSLNNCLFGNVKLLYLSPEMIQNFIVIERIKKMNINLLVVDEAHCISEWGHDFRPSYRNISKIRKEINSIPILALTATATENVINDIQKNLSFKNYNVIKSSFYRKNISYVVDTTSDKKSRLLKLLNKIKSSVIIYVSKRRSSEEINQFLLDNNFSSDFYHGGLNQHVRAMKQKKWMNSQTRIMVSTSAFGMGINKKDVKLVVNFDLPHNLETYLQQAGRAGRDGEQAYSFLFANENDINTNQNLLDLGFPSITEIKNVYQYLADFFRIPANHFPQNSYSFDIKSFCNKYKLNYTKTLNIIRYLEKEELILYRTNIKSVSKFKFIISKGDLYKFQIANKYYDLFIKHLLRKYQNIFNSYSEINFNELEVQTNTSAKNLEKLMNRLNEMDIVEYIPKNDINCEIRYLKTRQDTNSIYFDNDKLIKRKNNLIFKQKKIAEYINNNGCRNIFLLRYFGEKKLFKCGKCDICIYEKRDKFKKEEYEKISIEIINLLKENELSIEDIYTLLPLISKKKITNVIEILFDNDEIYKLGNKYKSKYTNL